MNFGRKKYKKRHHIWRRKSDETRVGPINPVLVKNGINKTNKRGSISFIFIIYLLLTFSFILQIKPGAPESKKIMHMKMEKSQTMESVLKTLIQFTTSELKGSEKKWGKTSTALTLAATSSGSITSVASESPSRTDHRWDTHEAAQKIHSERSKEAKKYLNGGEMNMELPTSQIKLFAKENAHKFHLSEIWTHGFIVSSNNLAPQMGGGTVWKQATSTHAQLSTFTLLLLSGWFRVTYRFSELSSILEKLNQTKKILSES